MSPATQTRVPRYSQTNEPADEFGLTDKQDHRPYIYVEAEGKDFRARMISDATLPYTGEGRSMDAAVNSLREMLKDALETILEAKSLSPAMEKQKASLLKVFEYERTSDL